MLRKLLQTRTQVEADLLISLLRAEGLHPSDLRPWPNVSLAGGDLFYTIEVPVQEAEAAGEILGSLPTNHGLTAGPNLSVIKTAALLVIIALTFGMLVP